MTVSTSINRIEYTGNGVTVAFSVNFMFQNNSDLLVTVNGVTMDIGTDYTVLGAGNPNGGTVTFTYAPSNGAKVVITNAPPITQTFSFVNYETLLEENVGNALDKLTIICQSLARSIGDALTANTLISTPTWQGQGLELRSIAPGTYNDSAATVAQVQAMQVAAGNVPSPVGGDNGKPLVATGAGTFSWQTSIGVPFTFNALQTISAGNATSNTDFLDLTPTDYATGKPLLGFRKDSTANKWVMRLWDGVNNNGTIDVQAQNFTVNGSVLHSLTVPQTTASPSADQNDYSPLSLGSSVSGTVFLTPTASIKISGLVAQGSKAITLVNATDSTSSGARLIILTNEDSGSLAANRFALPDKMPIFLPPGQQVTLVYNTTTSRWMPVGGVTDWLKGFALAGDFENGGGGAWASTASGTNASVGESSAISNVIGVSALSTGTTASGRAGVGLGLTTYANFDSTKAGYFFHLSRIAAGSQLSNGTDRYYIHSGLNDAGNAGASASNGVYWAYKDNVSANWLMGTANASARTENASSITVTAATPVWLGLFMNGDWTRAEYFASTDGTTWNFTGVITTNLPSGVSNSCWYGTMNTKSLGTNTRLAYVDFMGYRSGYRRV